ncbi:PI31 proteasome regulator N-terminal-domain-containing protein [Echria macrotheca]|uniref:PI31 proteasome regulator N-terminal-domain-containing protein n=1 Tax=Echria macrotheca TaxID=438768 RepID=A0AAJ0BC73_9PEZI|nr:PI31 proteasome regulator N-terminal-domain-containing protein [Echria macrotheca]
MTTATSPSNQENTTTREPTEITMSAPLSPESILGQMAQALPTHEPDDTTSDLSSSLDAIALFVHACMVNLEYKLVGLNEDDKLAAECERLSPRLPAQWNRSLNSHSFVYRHPQSSMTYIIKVDRLGSKIETRGLAVGHERIARFEISARDYISPSSLPLRIPFVESSSQENKKQEDRGEPLIAALRSLFVSTARIADLAGLLKVSIIQRLLPSLQKEGYEEESPDYRAARQDADETARRGTGARPNPLVPVPGNPEPAMPNPYPAPDAFTPPPRAPVPAGDFPPPGFDDEYDIYRRPGAGLIPPGLRGPGAGMGSSPFGIGGSDLYPAGLGPDDPLRASFVPGRNTGPGSGGMHPTFDDPLFQGPRGQGDGSGFDPQVPPGARWDPLGPGGAPRFGGGRPGGRGGGGFGGGFGRGNGFGDII